MGPRQFIADQLLAKADVIRAMHERVQLCQDPQTEFALLRESLGVGRINHILRVHATRSCTRNELQKSTKKLFPGFTEDSSDQSCIGYKRARDIAAPAHLGALMAARPRIQAMIQYAVTAGFLPKQPLETRPDAVIGAATSTYFEALDDEDSATAKLYVQKVAQAADEAWQQTVDGHNGPFVTNLTGSELEHPGFS